MPAGNECELPADGYGAGTATSGSHHSWNYYWGGFNQAQIDKLKRTVFGREWDGNLWSLSPEEMKALRSNVDMWTQIQNTGKGGYGGRLTENWMTT